MSKKEFNTFKYGNKTIMQEIETLPNGNRKITSRTINGILTDKYDDIRLKYIFGAQKLLTIREFFELIVGDRFEKKDYVLEIYRDFEKVRHCKTIDELMYYHKWASHFIPNTFYKWNDRTLENSLSKCSILIAEISKSIRHSILTAIHLGPTTIVGIILVEVPCKPLR